MRRHSDRIVAIILSLAGRSFLLQSCFNRYPPFDSDNGAARLDIDPAPALKVSCFWDVYLFVETAKVTGANGVAYGLFIGDCDPDTEYCCDSSDEDCTGTGDGSGLYECDYEVEADGNGDPILDAYGNYIVIADEGCFEY